MKRSVLTTLFLLTILAITASAQSRGSYFFENSLLRSKLNPAFTPKTTYISVPVVGSVNVDIASNVGLSNFVLPKGDMNYLFLSESIPAEAFLSKLPEKDPYLQERVETDLLGGGMAVGRYGYATVSLSVVESGRIVLPGNLMRFLKKSSETSFQGQFDSPQVRFAGYTALSVGYSHDMSAFVKGLRVGGRVKLLAGITAADVAVDRIDLQLTDHLISARTHGAGSLSGFGFDPEQGLSFAGFGLRGIGAAVDLGASYWLPFDGPFVDGIEFSASACDLGGLRFNRTLSSLSMDRSLSYKGISDFSANLKAEMNRLLDEIKALTRFDVSEGDSFGYLLPASIHVGATASFFQDRANAGLLYYHAVGHDNLMTACGYSPFEWLNLGINWTFLGPASRFGFYAEYIPQRYVGVFFGMERASWRHNSDHVAIGNFTDTFAFGLNILFGDYSFWR